MYLPAVSYPLERYLAEINRFPLLSREEEYELAERYHRFNELEAAHRLICANLRFVVKIAHEYRHYGFRFLDLIQEGNIGLMMAVKKYDPTRGVRLISYAVRWIRAYIQEFILKSWSLVKLGTTQTQRKLFYKLSKVQRALPYLGFNYDRAAESLGVSSRDLREMEVRREERDLSLDETLNEDSQATHLDFLADGRPNQEEFLTFQQEGALAKERIKQAMLSLSPRERFIVEKRVMAERAVTLQKIAERFHLSRERVRQIEKAALKKLKKALAEAA